MNVKNTLYSLGTTTRGLATQMKRLEVISENIANVEKAPDENGNLYRRQRLVERSETGYGFRRFDEELSLRMRRSRGDHMPATGTPGRPETLRDPFEVVEENGERLVFDPEHPLANEEGYVRMPDVNLVEEMVDLVAASRTYEANVTVINAAKQMARRSLEI